MKMLLVAVINIILVKHQLMCFSCQRNEYSASMCCWC